MGILVLVIIFVVAGMILSVNDTGEGRPIGSESVPDPSITNDRASGMRGLFELSAKLGYKVDVNRDDWRRLPKDASLLIVAAPQTRQESTDSSAAGVLNGRDAKALLKWLSTGRTALIMAGDVPAPRSVGQPPSKLPGGDFGDEAGFTIGDALSGDRASSALAPLQPVPLVRGVNLIEAHGGQRIKRLTGGGVDLFGHAPRRRARGPVGGDALVSVIAVGSGRMIVVADGYFACNRNLIRADNAVFLTNILADSVASGQKVLFDEYHHGDISSGNTIWDALGLPAQSAIAQFVLAALIMAIVLVPRFGTPRPVQSKEHRNTGEYVSSLASLYRGARATAPALELIYRQFLRDLCHRLSVPTDLSLAALADAAGRRSHVNAGDLKKLLGRCERCIETQSVTENELLDLVRHMERFRKELGID